MSIFKISEASPKAKAKITSWEDLKGVVKSDHHLVKYPFNQLKIGECFTVPLKESKEFSIRVSASTYSKKLSKKFCVIIHEEFAVVECARIA